MDDREGNNENDIIPCLSLKTAQKKGWDDMEVEIEARIKKYRASEERLMPETILAKIEGIWKPFQDATPDNPMNADKFLSALNLDVLQDFFKGLYRRTPKYPAEAMLKAVLFMDLKKMKFFPELVRYFMSNPRAALALGFQMEEGKVNIPSKQNLWHFCNIRLKEHWETVFTLMRDESVATAKTLGLRLGEKTLEDAMPLQSRPRDSEAEYNDHYKIKGYKVDSVTDQNHFVPLSVKVTSINADEAKNLIPQLTALNRSEIRVEEHTIDGGYADYELIGWMGIHGIQGWYKIHTNWVYNTKGDEHYIRALYQHHWKDPGFKTHASLSEILSFLFKKGYTEEVGAFYRNQTMIAYTQNAQEYLKRYHVRSRQEGHHGYWKEHLALEDRLRTKGLERITRYVLRNFCSILAVVLCRLQHHCKDNLTSIAYLT